MTPLACLIRHDWRIVAAHGLDPTRRTCSRCGARDVGITTTKRIHYWLPVHRPRLLARHTQDQGDEK